MAAVSMRKEDAVSQRTWRTRLMASYQVSQRSDAELTYMFIARPVGLLFCPEQSQKKAAVHAHAIARMQRAQFTRAAPHL
eukprot:6190681-Pleurochrysis_carterae.AAC.4